MSPLIVVFGAGILMHCCVFSALEIHGRMMNTHMSGVKNMMNMSLASAPESEIRQFLGNPISPFAPGYRPQKCPLCDSSVYAYCGEKLLHDACCCTEYQHDLPYQCKLADCRFLHANSCKEHRLIANCCCSDDYRAILKTLANI